MNCKLLTDMTDSRRGPIPINTGPGKGKTTAAMGTAWRAVGNAHPLLVELADTVTEMQEVKHAYEKGVLAQRGIEY